MTLDWKPSLYSMGVHSLFIFILLFVYTVTPPKKPLLLNVSLSHTALKPSKNSHPNSKNFAKSHFPTHPTPSASESHRESAFAEFRPHPSYPSYAQNQGWQGDVLLELTANRSGEIESITLKKSSGYVILDQAAEETVKTWRLKPLSHLEIPVLFRLTD